MTSPSAGIKTEADALRDILSWSEGLPPWQRDALRRLVLKGELTDTDFDELNSLCKDKSLPSEPLAGQHISAKRSGAPTVSIKNLHGVKNVNALAKDQILNFATKGVTIIYGDNGSGKSGYVRILKSACRARTPKGREEPILRNINEDSKEPQCAEIEYQVGAQTQTEEWENGKSMDDLLSEISVFDSCSANVHIEETNDLAYIPYPMKLLEHLVNACKHIKNNIDEEISTIRAQTPRTCSPDTKVGDLILLLSKSTAPEIASKLATLSKKESARLAELTSDTPERLRDHKRVLKDLRSSLKALADVVSLESCKELQMRAEDFKTKSDAAKLDSQDLSKDEPLDGVGSEAWKKLWEAARDYSITDAYPDLEFPVIKGEDIIHCVLCQQKLDQGAEIRLKRFEVFVQGRMQKEASTAKNVLSDFRKKFLDNTFSKSHKNFLEWKLFCEYELGNSDLASSVWKFTTRAHWRLRAILRTNSEVELDIPTLARVGVDAVIGELETREQVLLEDDGSDERKAIRAELDELRNQNFLSDIKDDVLAEIDRLNSITTLEKYLKDTVTNNITSKNTTLSKKLVTDQLLAQFKKEISLLNLTGLVELIQGTSHHGVACFKISLVKNKSGNIGAVLSEGEHSCVAFSGFMAELATNSSDSGIIFDDPVSSLDHLNRATIAKRLAEEGRVRQVIVFTHDIPFLSLLRDACYDLSPKTEIAIQHIKKLRNIPGHCRDGAPEKVKNVPARLKAIRKKLAKVRDEFENDPDSIDWLTEERGLIDSIRQAWEAAVESSISPVLRTFSGRVTTNGFAKLLAITKDDVNRMREHYGLCSEPLHNSPSELNLPAPTPDIIEQRLDVLEEWHKSLSERQKEIKK